MGTRSIASVWGGGGGGDMLCFGMGGRLCFGDESAHNEVAREAGTTIGVLHGCFPGLLCLFLSWVKCRPSLTSLVVLWT